MGKLIFIYFIIAAVGAVGWVLNIIKLVNSDIDPLTAIVIMRAIGIFVAPLEAVLGYL